LIKLFLLVQSIISGLSCCVIDFQLTVTTIDVIISVQCYILILFN